MNQDLTVGKPEQVLLRFCLPLFGSIIFQQLYNIADSLVVGKFVGEAALAAVGNSYEITLIYLAVAFGCNIGGAVLVSRFFGAHDYQSMKTAVATAWISSGLLCLLLMLLGLFFSGTLLLLIQTPEEVFSDSLLYLNIYTLGLPFIFFYNISSGLFAAMGDSRTPFFFLAASSLSNVAMDILFVTVFSMGVAGVAWATFLCQGISCLLSVLLGIRRLRSLPRTEKAPLFSLSMLAQFAVIAIPSILQQGFISIGNIIIQGIINSFGTAVMAGYSAAVKLNNLVITSFTTIGNGVSNYTAQNLGARKFDRIQTGFYSGIRLVWCLSLPVALLYFLGSGHLLSLFLESPSEAALTAGSLYLRILAPFYFVVSAKLIADGILKGTSQMLPFMIGTFADLLLRVLLALLFSRTSLGSTGIWCAWPIGWSASALLSNYFCRQYLKKAH